MVNEVLRVHLPTVIARSEATKQSIGPHMPLAVITRETGR